MDNKDTSLHRKLCWPGIFHHSYIKYQPFFSFPGFQKIYVLQFFSVSLLRMIVYAVITSVSTSVPPHPHPLYLCVGHSLVSNLSVGSSMLVLCGYSARHIYCLPKWMHVHSAILLEHNISSANMYVCTLTHVCTTSYALFYARTHTHTCEHVQSLIPIG